MRISTKLYGMVFFSLLGLAAMLLTLKVLMGQLESQVDGITHDALPSIIAAEEIKAQFIEARRQITLHAGSTDAASKQAAGAELEKLHGQLRQALDSYKSRLLSNAQDRASIDTLSASIDKWYALIPGFMQLSNQNTPQGNAAAMEYLRRTTIPVSDAAYRDLQQMVNLNRQVSEESGAQAIHAATSATWILMSLGSALLVLMVGSSLLLTRSISRSLNELDAKISLITTHRDLTQRVQEHGRDEITHIAQRLNQLLQMLQTGFTELTQIGQTVGGYAGEVASASEQMTEAVEQVSESTSNMSAAVEQMTVSVSHVADRSAQADQSGREAGSEAKVGAEVINDTIDMIRSTSDSVRQAAVQIEQLKDKTASIGTVVGVIKDIADQTNLLALNAAIEAARAGEQGRGFAVVADEVRKLAERTAQSTQEITVTVQSMQDDANQTVASMHGVVTQVEHGVESANQATEAIQSILARTGDTVERIAEISHSMREQSMASTSIAQQIERVAQMAEESHSGSLNNATTATRLNEQATLMLETIARFKV